MAWKKTHIQEIKVILDTLQYLQVWKDSKILLQAQFSKSITFAPICIYKIWEEIKVQPE